MGDATNAADVTGPWWSPRRVRRAFSTVRARATIVAAAVVAIALVAASIVGLAVLRSNLTASLDDTLRQQALDRAALIDDGVDASSLTDSEQEESLVWIGRPDGTPLAVGTELVPIDSPIPDTLDSVGGATLLVEERSHGENEREVAELRLASATTADGEIVVLAGAETEVIAATLSKVARLFSIGVPLIVLLVAVLAWATAGRVLAPVEAIRRRTLEISGSNRSERVPVPRTTDEIHALAITMNDMLGRLEATHETLRRFTADASHELKSPVANLRSLVETHQSPDPDWPPLRDRLQEESERLGDLVDNLLFLSTSDDPTSASTRPSQRVDLDELVFDEAQVLVATNRVAVDLAAVEPHTIDGDARALARLVRNLADNAARHAESTVWFGVAEHDSGHVVITVGDDGPGIPPEDRQRVVERFTRLDDARARDVGGSGLGLAIVSRIVADHDGRLEIADRPGGGALLRVVLASK